MHYNRLHHLLLTFIIATDMMAQSDYHPFIEGGKVWQCVSVWGNMADPEATLNTEDNFYEIGEEVIIGDKACRTLNGKIIYEEDKRVYCYDEEDGRFYLIYDFGCNVGDTFDVVDFLFFGTGEKESYRCTVVAKDSVLSLENEFLSRISIYAEAFHEYFLWIEGIGSLRSPLENIALATTGGYIYVKSCRVNETCFFTFDNYFQHVGVESHWYSNATKHRIYDLSGRRVDAKAYENQKLKKGIYIKDGRKKLVR